MEYLLMIKPSLVIGFMLIGVVFFARSNTPIIAIKKQ